MLFSHAPENRIKELRDYHGMSQQRLVDLINQLCGTTYNQRSLSRFERRENDIPSKVVMALALIFRCNIEYLLCMTDDEMPLRLRPEYLEAYHQLDFDK